MKQEVLVMGSRSGLGGRLVRRLRENGYSARLADGLDEAIRVVRECSVPLVFAEASVPEEEDRIRSRISSARSACRVIFLTNLEQLKDSGHLFGDLSTNYVLRERDLSGLIQGDEPSVRTARRTEALTEVLDMVVSLTEANDPYFAGFTNRVARLAGEIATELGIEGSGVDDIVVATLLRDLGKAGIKNDIVEQSDSLSPEERDHMKRHVLWSVRLIEHIDFGGKVVPLVRHHHERYDGTGYPDGLKGREIPVGARIIAAAESFAAVTSDRPHRAARSVEEAIDELMANAGTQFDPEVVEALTKVLRRSSSVDRAGRRSILIVDPEMEARRLLRMRLLNEGYEVHATSELTEDFATRLSNMPSVILFDASDGGDEAVHWLRRLREQAGSQPVPFALMIPDDDPDVKIRALEHGVDDILVKTRSLQEMVARVKNILVREAARTQHLRGKRSIGVSGNLRTFSVPDIAQMLCMGQKTASVTLEGQERTGTIWFRSGRVVHADDGTDTGATAFRGMLEWDDAEFLIQHGKVPAKATMDVDPMSILLEHFSLVDEITHQVEDGLSLDRSSGAAVSE